MSIWKDFLNKSYCVATMPWRKAVLASQRHANKVPVYILFYHRVADEYPNPWSISCDGFRQQIDWLQDNFDLISLQETQRRIRNGNDRPAVAITFDDGYADNSSFALPMLIERNIPVTYFVTTYHTAHGKPFPHDVDCNQPLATNSIESLRALANAGVEIGGHTRTHIDLGKGLSDEQLLDEVIGATKEMESMIDTTIHYFAFPYGQRENLDPRVFQLLLDNGFSGVCSAYGGLNSIGDDAFHLQRLHGDPNFQRVKNWLTGDPRLSKVDRYEYQQDLTSDFQAVGQPEEQLISS
jgi:peptidoglycan/xylan/chitin deacetylase (PgdA/CDA1 family)